MLRKLPQVIQDDVEATVRALVSQSIFLNVSATAEAVRQRNEDQNVALEDIAAVVAMKASQYGCAVELGYRPAPAAAAQALNS